MPSLPLLRNSSHLSFDTSTTWALAGMAANSMAVAVNAHRSFMGSVLLAARSNPLGPAMASASPGGIPVRSHGAAHVRERAVGQLGHEQARWIHRTGQRHAPLRDTHEAGLPVIRLVAHQHDQ